jgi:hypothetical protein
MSWFNKALVVLLVTILLVLVSTVIIRVGVDIYKDQKYHQFCTEKCSHLYSSCIKGEMIKLTRETSPLITCECYYGRNTLNLETTQATFIFMSL